MTKTIYYDIILDKERVVIYINPGKIFESEIRDSVPNNIFFYRLKDPAQGFSGGSTTRFSLHNECDIFLYKYPVLVALELKSTQNTSLTFSLTSNDKNIKACQIKGLSNFSLYDGIRAGFLFNFRKTGNTYFLDINDFLLFLLNSTKKSINEKDVIEYGGLEIESRKKRKRFVYNIEILVKEGELR